VARGGIKFNHAKHLLEYFKQPDAVARAPQACTECHAASPAEHKIRTPGFDTACARCHAEQIPQNDLVLLRLSEPTADATKIVADDATAFMTWFFQRAGATNYGVALQQFIAAAAKDGVGALAKTLRVQQATKDGPLLTGLSPELLVRPAQLWMKGEKFEPASLKAESGWYWLEDLYPELRYKPRHTLMLSRARGWSLPPQRRSRNQCSGFEARRGISRRGDESAGGRGPMHQVSCRQRAGHGAGRAAH